MQRIFIILVLFFLSNVLFAYKVETHVWIGQEVINDLEDGAVSIQAGSQTITVPVRQEIVNAILLNRGSYRAGNIGPDAYPDIFTGQFVVHPGVEGSWNTDDWLKYLVKSENQTPEGTAFIYGYLGHAAADIFAHTYVNQYSGNIFDILSELKDGTPFNDAFIEEERHIELEKYIATFNPPITDSTGNNLGAPHGLIKAPHNFLRDRLILNDEVALRNEAGSALHLSLAHKLRKNLISFSQNELYEMDVYAAKTLVYWFTCSYLDYCYMMSDRETDAFVETAYEIHRIINRAHGEPLEELQEAKTKLVQSVEQLVALDVALQQRLLDTFNSIIGLERDVISVENQLIDVIRQLNDLPGICNIGLFPSIQRSFFNLPGLPKFPDPTDPLPDPLPNPIPDPCELVDELLNLHQSLNNTRSQLLGQLQQTNNELAGIIEEISNVLIDAINIENAITGGATDFLLMITQDVNVTRSLVLGWVNDIETGMYEYVISSEEMIKETMRVNGDPLSKLTTWWDCWGKSVAGIPSSITNTACNVTQRIESIRTSINNLENRILSLEPIGRAIVDAKQRLEQELSVLQDELFYALTELLTDIKVQRIVDVINAPASDARLNSIFGTDLSSNRYKGILEIPNMAERVKAEMNMVNGYFSSTDYNPIRNSIMLAKLTLLDASGLNQFLSQLTGSTLSLYESGPFEQSNILFGIARTIDGNHQWLEIAPPYPRRDGFSDTGWPSQRRYGYQSTTTTGFKMWNHCAAKEQVFGNVFQGPLNLELYVPSYSAVLSSSYPYRPSYAMPYPSSAGNWPCGTGPWLISVITMLLN